MVGTSRRTIKRIVHLRKDNSQGIVVAASEFDLEKNLRILGAF